MIKVFNELFGLVFFVDVLMRWLVNDSWLLIFLWENNYY